MIAVAKAAPLASAQANALLLMRLILKISTQHLTDGYVSLPAISGFALTCKTSLQVSLYAFAFPRYRTGLAERPVIWP
jgi:hypothetical protein